MMGEFIFDECWSDRAKDMQTALEYIKKYYMQSAPEAVPTFDYEAEIAKLERKLDALIDMRTDGEITKEEYNKKRADYEAQIKNLRSQATAVSPATSTTNTLDLDRIISVLKDISDSKTALGHDTMDELVSSVVPTSEGVYEWHLLTKPDAETSVNLAVKGRANSKERPYVYLYGEEADKSASSKHDVCSTTTEAQQGCCATEGGTVHNVAVVNFDCLRRLLHRLRSDKDRRTPFHTFSIGFDEAKAFRKATGSYLRENQWNDLTVDIYLEY